jgi:triosephosphate isomerase
MKSIIIANWKMNPKTLVEAKQLFNSIKNGIKNIKNIEVVVCPPFVYLSELGVKNKESRIKLGAQDCFWKEKGAFTGEISPSMLKKLGCQYIILGHSERRKYLNETNEMINKKINAIINTKLKPILCIGETEEERNDKKTFEVLAKQLEKSFNHLPNKFLRNLIIAYEPVWAIGTGRACGVREARIVNLFIKKALNKNIPILYGGSVNSKNALEYLKEENFQGLLVGGASLDASDFIKIIKIASRA